MDNPGGRLEQAVRTRDERVTLAWIEANPPATCRGCGRPLETILRRTDRAGRTRIWCSNACRQRGYRARKTGASSAARVEEPRSTEPGTPELDDCIAAVLQSPTAVASVLDVIRLALRDGVLDRSEYADVQVALLALRGELDGTD